jgi:hypothetical protein
MTDHDRYDEMLARMQRSAAEEVERRQRYHARLCSIYGSDDWPRATVLIFDPNHNEKDQEIRAAVKIGAGEWTLSGRGGSRTWNETLEKLGPGKVMQRVIATQPEPATEADQPSIGPAD